MESHYVSTAYIYDRRRREFLLVHHRKLGKWMPPGGHLDPGELPHAGALREAEEEIGVAPSIIKVADMVELETQESLAVPSPFCILQERIEASGIDGEHMHIDFIYVAEIDRGKLLRKADRELADIRWFHAEDVENLNTFENVRAICRLISGRDV